MSGEHSIAALCAALAVTPAGDHAWRRAAPGARERAEAELAEQIASVHRTHRGPTGRAQVWVSDLTYVPTAQGWL